MDNRESSRLQSLDNIVRLELQSFIDAMRIRLSKISFRELGLTSRCARGVFSVAQNDRASICPSRSRIRRLHSRCNLQLLAPSWSGFEHASAEWKFVEDSQRALAIDNIPSQSAHARRLNIRAENRNEQTQNFREQGILYGNKFMEKTRDLPGSMSENNLPLLELQFE